MIFDQSIYEWSEERFKDKTPIVFVSAMGIAVRAIAPSVKNKLEDIPKILETPYINDLAPYKEEIELIRSLEKR